MERKLAVTAGAAIVVAGTLLHFVYGWSGGNAAALLVIPVAVAGVVEAVLLRDVRRVAWAALAETALGALAIVAIFYTYTGALGTGPVLWADITSFVLVVAAGQWLWLRILLSTAAIPPTAISLAGLLALLALYVAWTLSPPHLPVFQHG